jgi:hypothetical protein
MLPSKEDLKWKALISGKINHEFKCVPAGLMLARIKRELEHDHSESTMNRCVQELYTFFQKYESILKEDISIIFA